MEAGKPFRAEDWWIGKASLLMGLVYMLSALFHISFARFWPVAICSMVTIVGFAALGYLVNDYFDLEKDRIVGKKNFLLDKKKFQKICFFCLAIILLAAPWYYLPWDRVTLSMIAAQVMAYFIYSMPPLRLKERGFWGIVTDAMYAHGIPVLMAAYTYVLISGSGADIVLLTLLFCWQLTAGLRNVLMHQLSDLHNDLKNETITFAATREVSSTTVKFFRIPELFFLISLLVYCCALQPLFLIPIGAVVFSLIVCSMMPVSDGYRIYYPNIVYDQWLPYSFIVLLFIQDHGFILLFAVHGLLFSREIISELWSRVPWVHYRVRVQRSVRRLSDQVRLLANRTIYYVFRVFGVDLIRERTDAMEYLRRRINRQQK